MFIGNFFEITFLFLKKTKLFVLCNQVRESVNFSDNSLIISINLSPLSAEPSKKLKRIVANQSDQYRGSLNELLVLFISHFDFLFLTISFVYLLFSFLLFIVQANLKDIENLLEFDRKTDYKELTHKVEKIPFSIPFSFLIFSPTSTSTLLFESFYQVVTKIVINQHFRTKLTG